MVIKILEYKNKKFKIDLKVCSFLEKFSGLMFARREKANALLFNFRKPTQISLHSLFVFFPFAVLWLDDKDKIIGKRIVKPFEVSVSLDKPFFKIIEIPFNEKYKEIIDFLVERKV